MMKKVSLAIVAAIAAGQALAMPSKVELDKVSPVVQELMKPIHDEMKSGKKTRSEVADAAMKLVPQAESEAAKFLLIKGAFGLYVRDGAFDEALASLGTLRTAVADVPPENVANLIESSLRNVPKEKGGQLFELLDELKTTARYKSGLKNLKEKLATNPGNASLESAIAEHYAVLGDWTKALDAFTRGADKRAAAAAKAERDGSKPKKAIADFWWNYPPANKEALVRAFRRHAASLYSAALAANEIAGLHKVQVERRIAEVGPVAVSDIVAPVAQTKRSVEVGGVQLWENGPYWAECNVGASKPEESGYYFWWGDTVGYKRVGDRWDAVDGLRTGFSFSEKNCPTYGKDKAQLQTAGYIDATGNLTPAHDAATIHLGAPWRMPTYSEFDAMIKNCDTKWTTRNGISGLLAQGKNAYSSKSIFLPAGGRGENNAYLNLPSHDGIYWSSTAKSDYPNKSVNLVSFSRNVFLYEDCRFWGESVRPVRDPVDVSVQKEHKLYCVIDLTAGPNATKYPVSYLDSAPKSGWTDEYKTNKLVLRKIKPGRFLMGDQVKAKDKCVEVTLTKPYYIGVFEVTQRQWELVKGTRPSFFTNETCYATRPVERVDFGMVCGGRKGLVWPDGNQVDAESFLGILRKKTMQMISLPTEAEWEYAATGGVVRGNEEKCRNGENSWPVEVLGNPQWRDYGNGWGPKPEGRSVVDTYGTAKVGSYKPNVNGLYDMLGNVWEMCRDRFDWKSAPVGGPDPVGLTSETSGHVTRGGGWSSSRNECRFSNRGGSAVRQHDTFLGLRVCMYETAK